MLKSRKLKGKATPSLDTKGELDFSKYQDQGVAISIDGADFVKDVRPIGLISFDEALGGGIPLGRVVEIFGSEGTGKTTLSLQVVRAMQLENYKAAFIDMERTYSASYAKRFGITELLVLRPNYGEQAFNIIIDLARSGYTLIVVDSVASMIPKSEVDDEDESHALGLQARMMSRWLRKVVPILSENNCTVVFINQVRASMSLMSRANTEVTPGGASLRFFSSVRIELKRIGTIKYEHVVGSEIRMRMVKNKMEASGKFSELVLHFYFERGFCPFTDTLR